MKKFSFPKFKLTKKQLIITYGSIGFLAFLGITFFVLNGLGVFKFGQNSTTNTEITEYADDSENARNSVLQQYTSQDTSTTFKVYGEEIYVVNGEGETVGGGSIPALQMTESCSYSDGTEPVETTYILGLNPTEVHNHCLLTFKEITTFMEADDYLNAYVVLPDNSLVVLSTKGTPSIQVNIYGNEIRVVQENGYAYYRIEKKEEENRFTTQIGDVLLQVTGTEYYAQAQEDEDSKLWGSFQMLEGTAKVVDRASEFIYDMLVPEDYDYGVVNGFRWTDMGMWENDQFSYNKGLLYTFTYQDGVSEEGDPKVAAVEGFTAPYDFLGDQVMMTLRKYGFGNFTSNIGGNIEALVSEEIVDIQELRRENVSKEMVTLSEFWDRYQNAQESSSSGSGSASGSSTGTTTYSCGSGYTYVGNGKCCQNGSYLGTDGYCHWYSSNSGSSSSSNTPSYYYNDSEQCYSSGSASYQLFCQASSRGTIKNGRCCVSL